MKLNIIKIVAMIVFLEIIIITLLSPISRAETEKFTLSAKKNTIDIGEAIEVELNVTNGMQNQNQLAVVIRYDSSKLEIISDLTDTDGSEYLVENESLYNDILGTDDGIALGFVDDEDDTVSIVYYTDSAESYLKTNAKLANLKFKAINSGIAKISFDIIEYAYEDDEPTEITSNSELSIKINGEEKNTRYPDVTENDWFYNAVEYVSENNMMNGYTAGEKVGKFGPNDQITRGQIVTILYRREGSPVVSGNWTFKDTGMYDYYRDAIKWASQNGIVTGYTAGEDEGKFLPDNPITREQLAVILQRYAKYKNKSVAEKASLIAFGDYEKVSPWALGGLEWVVAKGIISGDLATNPPSINPQGNATRAQAATMIMRFCNNV